MKKVEAQTLEEAYIKASQVLECSISELQCEVVQYPAKGILGFLKKNAIIIARCTKKEINETPRERAAKETTQPLSEEENVATEIISVLKDESIEKEIEKDSVLDNFFEEVDTDAGNVVVEDDIIYDELALLIENELTELMSYSCFDIDVVEVDVRDNTALIFIDGNDAALLIGKEGYRYNALSYMLFSWLHTKYDLFIKLEIAEFLTTQQEMIKLYLQPVIKTIEKTGRGKTRYLDGILVQIALEQLRIKFPNKYVAVKTSKNGQQFVVINDFNTKNNG